jgi:hypothetical protein
MGGDFTNKGYRMKNKKEEISKEEMKTFLDFLKKVCEEGLSEKDEKILEDTKKSTELVEKFREHFENVKSVYDENSELMNDSKITIVSAIAIGDKVVFFNIQGNPKGRDAIKEHLE